jgi:Sec-independent protein translocase protein TatA
MDIFGIGPLEIIMILVIILIIVGPKEMVKMSSTIGKFIRQLMVSPTWRVVQETSRQLRNLPTTLARQAGIEELEKMQSELKEVSEALPKPEDLGLELGSWESTYKSAANEEKIGQDYPSEDGWIEEGSSSDDNSILSNGDNQA